MIGAMRHTAKRNKGTGLLRGSTAAMPGLNCAQPLKTPFPKSAPAWIAQTDFTNPQRKLTMLNFLPPPVGTGGKRVARG